jgi:hypothetical protein
LFSQLPQDGIIDAQSGSHKCILMRRDRMVKQTILVLFLTKGRMMPRPIGFRTLRLSVSGPFEKESIQQFRPESGRNFKSKVLMFGPGCDSILPVRTCVCSRAGKKTRIVDGR